MNVPRKRKSAATRKAEIVETAIRLSAELGPDRVTTQHLADAVGVTQPAIFRHFATKAEIWQAVGEQIANDMATPSTHAADAGTNDPHAQLLTVVGNHFVHIAQNPAVPAIIFSRELQADNEALRNRFSTLLKERRDELATLVRSAQDAGVHGAEMAADDAAHLIIAAIQGVSMRWLMEDRGFDLVDEGGRMLGALLDRLRA